MLMRYTEETGQGLEEAARRGIWEFGKGEFWPVNAVAYEPCFGKGRQSPRRPIAAEESRTGVSY